GGDRDTAPRYWTGAILHRHRFRGLRGPETVSGTCAREEGLRTLTSPRREASLYKLGRSLVLRPIFFVVRFLCGQTPDGGATAAATAIRPPSASVNSRSGTDSSHTGNRRHKTRPSMGGRHIRAGSSMAATAPFRTHRARPRVAALTALPRRPVRRSLRRQSKPLGSRGGSACLSPVALPVTQRLLRCR